MAGPFENSRRKLARANEHIRDFDKQMHACLHASEYDIVVEDDPANARHVVHRIRFRHSFPDVLIDSAADAVHNLRSALDGACYGLAVAAGNTSPKSAYFPFGGSEADFENNVKGRCKDIPAEVHRIFRAFRPDKGGDDVLWTLNSIAVADKHTLLRIALGGTLGDVTLVGGCVRMWVDPPWNRLQNEIEIGTFVRGSGLATRPRSACT